MCVSSMSFENITFGLVNVEKFFILIFWCLMTRNFCTRVENLWCNFKCFFRKNLTIPISLMLSIYLFRIFKTSLEFTLGRFLSAFMLAFLTEIYLKWQQIFFHTLVTVSATLFNHPKICGIITAFFSVCSSQRVRSSYERISINKSPIFLSIHSTIIYYYITNIIGLRKMRKTICCRFVTFF